MFRLSSGRVRTGVPGGSMLKSFDNMLLRFLLQYKFLRIVLETWFESETVVNHLVCSRIRIHEILMLGLKTYERVIKCCCRRDMS